MLQCGDPTGTGTGGPGYSFAEENLEGATYPRGTVAMAKSAAPASTGSQFFLVYGDSALPPEYTVVGEITKGLDVLDEIAEGGVAEADENGNTAPKTPVQIEDLAHRTGLAGARRRPRDSRALIMPLLPPRTACRGQEQHDRGAARGPTGAIMPMSCPRPACRGQEQHDRGRGRAGRTWAVAGRTPAAAGRRGRARGAVSW